MKDLIGDQTLIIALIGVGGTITGVIIGWFLNQINSLILIKRENRTRFHTDKFVIYGEFIKRILEIENILFPSRGKPVQDDIEYAFSELKLFYPRLLLIASPKVLELTRELIHSIFTHTNFAWEGDSANGGQMGWGPRQSRVFKPLRKHLINEIRNEFGIKKLNDIYFDYFIVTSDNRKYYKK
jgi:hypothetical protein